jgi:outer membrane protein assembly factor BamD (BamD/ComL family)
MRIRDRFFLLFLFAAIVGVASPRASYADDPRTEARTHYQSGLKLYSAGKYQDAIKEFSSAQQIMPADLNNYNLALCYDSSATRRRRSSTTRSI